jgi:hypothetical protein
LKFFLPDRVAGNNQFDLRSEEIGQQNETKMWKEGTRKQNEARKPAVPGKMFDAWMKRPIIKVEWSLSCVFGG